MLAIWDLAHSCGNLERGKGQPPGELEGGEGANLEPRNNFLHHGQVESVEFFGPVELNGAHTEVGVEEDVVGRVRLWDHGYRRGRHLGRGPYTVRIEGGHLLGGGEGGFTVCRGEKAELRILERRGIAMRGLDRKVRVGIAR